MFHAVCSALFAELNNWSALTQLRLLRCCTAVDFVVVVVQKQPTMGAALQISGGCIE